MGQGSQAFTQSSRRAAQSSGQGQAVEHQVVTPSQVTCPGSPTAQLLSTAEQLVTLVPLLQETVPETQVAVALQRPPPGRGGGDT